MDPQAKLVDDTIAQHEKERIARMTGAVATGTCMGIIGALLILAVIGAIGFVIWTVVQ